MASDVLGLSLTGFEGVLFCTVLYLFLGRGFRNMYVGCEMGMKWDGCFFADARCKWRREMFKGILRKVGKFYWMGFIVGDESDA